MVTTTAESTPLAGYRFLPDRQGARMLCELHDLYWAYLACDACAPAAPASVFQFTNSQVYNGVGFEITSKGQPRVLSSLSSSALVIQSCDYGCDLASRWTATTVASARGSAADMHAVEGDGVVIAYESGGNVVVRVP